MEADTGAAANQRQYQEAVSGHGVQMKCIRFFLCGSLIHVAGGQGGLQLPQHAT